MVKAMDAQPEESRLGQELIHFSSLLGMHMCPRQYVLAGRSEHTIYNSVNGAMRIVWKIGRAVENHIREQYIAGVQGEGVVGKWSCLCGRKEISGEKPSSSTHCTRCGWVTDKYNELSLVDVDTGIIGNPDMILQKNGLHQVVEIKSIKRPGPDGFEGLNDAIGPKADHAIQGCGYRRLLQKNGYRVSPNIIVLYGAKDYKFGNVYKEFQVNAAQYDSILDALWDIAHTIKRHREQGTLPERERCVSCDSTLAKGCPVVQACFD